MEQEIQTNRKGLSAAVLKNTAVVLMFFNHFMAVLYDAHPYGAGLSSFQWYITRPSFGLFAFLIAEGMVYTRSRKKYMIRLLSVAVISEIIYDLCFERTFFDWSDQNVFFDLFMGTVAICICDRLREAPFRKWVAVLCLAVLTVLLRFNYNVFSVGLIVTCYELRNDRKKLCTVLPFVITGLALLIVVIQYAWMGYFGVPFRYIFASAVCEMHTMLMIPFILLYNGEKGKQLPRAFYYAFYPAHLLLIWIVCSLISGAFLGW